MVNQYKFSIVVPIYNAEDYLDRCIKSLLSQTLDDYEIILVNDGSIDGSGKIISDYAKKYTRIVPIHQNNNGVSQARNKGMSLARGEYIGFVDADDWIEPDMFEKLYIAAKSNKCDIVIFNHKYEVKGKLYVANYNIQKDKVLFGEDMLEVMKLLLNNGFMCPVWNKVYKRSFIINNGLRFEKGRNYGEDFLFNFHAFKKACRCIYIDYCGYYYYETENSLIHLDKTDILNRDIDYYLLCSSLIRDNNFKSAHFKEFEDAVVWRFVDSCIGALYHYIILRKDLNIYERHKKIVEITKNHYVRDAVKKVESLDYPYKNRFNKYMIRMLNNRNVLGIVTGMLYTKYKSDAVRLAYGKKKEASVCN